MWATQKVETMWEGTSSQEMLHACNKPALDEIQLQAIASSELG